MILRSLRRRSIRLTLNMLMSFAEFEREMIAERTRDKIAASRVDQMARSKERQRAIQQALQSGSSTARNRMGGK
jgi:hypothetical protein